MTGFVVRRLLYGLLVMFGVVTAVFFLFNVLPGDPARMMLGQRADMASVNAINKDLGRDKPMLTQYINYLNDLSPVSIHNTEDKDSYWFLDPDKYSSSVTLFNIGGENSLVLKFPYLRRSYQSKKSVAVVIAEALPNTAVLAFTSMIFALIVGVTIGIFAALHRNKFFDRFSLISAVAGMSLPSFFAAILAAWIFAFLLADITGLSMYGSLYGVDDFGEGEYMDLRNLILPALTLGIRPLAVIIQLTRNSLLEELSSDYVRTAKSKGLSTRKVVLRHALKNAMNPVITTFSGWLASLLAGAVFIEYIFDWKGIGVVIVNGLEKYDFPIVMGCVLTVSVILIIITILVDILYAWLDPRVRLQ